MLSTSLMLGARLRWVQPHQGTTRLAARGVDADADLSVRAGDRAVLDRDVRHGRRVGVGEDRGGALRLREREQGARVRRGRGGVSAFKQSPTALRWGHAALELRISLAEDEAPRLVGTTMGERLRHRRLVRGPPHVLGGALPPAPANSGLPASCRLFSTGMRESRSATRRVRTGRRARSGGRLRRRGRRPPWIRPSRGVPPARVRDRGRAGGGS